METIGFVSRNHIFYLKRELEGKLHKTQRLKDAAVFHASHPKSVIMK